jgi:hypothetical protein
MAWFGKIRPQIFMSIIVLGAIALFGLQKDMVEVGTACIGGIIALGMKILEGD